MGRPSARVARCAGALALGLALSQLAVAQEQFRDHFGFPSERRPTTAIEPADIDGDGDVDFVVGATWPPQSEMQLRVVENLGAERFRLGQLLSHLNPPDAITSGDVDGDGDPDFVVTGWGGVTGGLTSLYENDGTGTLTEVTGAFGPNPLWGRGRDVDLADVDADGDPDLVVAMFQHDDVLLINDGSGRFASSASFPGGLPNTFGIEAADFDRDGDVDLVIGGYQTGGVAELRFYRNDGLGGFTDDSAGRFPPWPVGVARLEAADLDGDGAAELLVLSGFRLTLLDNDGTGHFVDVSYRLRVHDDQRAVAIADMDLDGDRDVIVAGTFWLEMWSNDGRGTFRRTWAPAGVRTVAALATADVDLDGDSDLLIGNFTGQVNDPESEDELWLNQHRQTQLSAAPVVGTPFRFEIASAPGYRSLFAVAVPVVAFAQVRTWLPPFGVLELDPASMSQLPPVYLPPPGGHVPVQIAVPQDPSLRGRAVLLQSVIVEPSASARLTNAWWFRVR